MVDNSTLFKVGACHATLDNYDDVAVAGVERDTGVAGVSDS